MDLAPQVDSNKTQFGYHYPFQGPKKEEFTPKKTLPEIIPPKFNFTQFLDIDTQIYYKPQFEKSPLEEFVEGFDKNVDIKDIQKKLFELVPSPDFSDKYSALKYIYDYYVGNLKLDIQNTYSSAINRMSQLEEVWSFNRFDQILKEKNRRVIKENKLNLGSKKVVIPGDEELRELVTLDRISYFRKNAAVHGKLFYENFDDIQWKILENDKISYEMAFVLQELQIKRIANNLQRTYGPQVIENLEKENEALTLLTTNTIRDQAQRSIDINSNANKNLNANLRTKEEDVVESL